MREIDPIIHWPNNAPPLRPMIAQMQQLNPTLGLRVAVRDDESEYLLYAGTAFEVVRIAMPAMLSNDAMSGLTEQNRESFAAKTDLGLFELGPHRLERTNDGGLLIRPRSEAVEGANGRFAFAVLGADVENRRQAPIELWNGRMTRRWSIFRDGHGCGRSTLHICPRVRVNECLAITSTGTPRRSAQSRT